MESSQQLYSSIKTIVVACIAEANAGGLSRIPIEQEEAAPILAVGGLIESFGLVSLLATIEQDLAADLDITLKITRQVAAVLREGENPLATVGSFLTYIVEQVENSATHMHQAEAV
jgi:hypothetical protein